MSEIVNGYTLMGPLTNANAGFCRWGFAKKDGTEFFIKEFLNPVYPTKESPYTPAMQEKIKTGCLGYQKEKQRLYRAINETSDGNLVRIEEFFRWGSKYYITTRRIRADLTSKELQSQPWQERLRVCCALCHALMQMHEMHIVHADVKEDNIILTRSIQGGITAKLIDVDCSFFEDTPPEDGEDLGGDQKYFSPEGYLFKQLGLEELNLSCKMDVYAMGLLIHQLLVGKLPEYGDEYNYAFEATLDDMPIKISSSLPQVIQTTLSQMLQKEPADRPTMKQVFFRLRHALAPDVVWDRTAAATVTAAPVRTTSGTETSRPTGSKNPGSRVRLGSFDRAVAMVREMDSTIQTATSAPKPVAKITSTEDFFSCGGDL